MAEVREATAAHTHILFLRLPPGQARPRTDGGVPEPRGRFLLRVQKRPSRATCSDPSRCLERWLNVRANAADRNDELDRGGPGPYPIWGTAKASSRAICFPNA